MMTEFLASGVLQFVGVGIVGALISTFNAWVKEYLAKRKALYELRTNPFCKVGVKLTKFQDAGGKQLLGPCRIRRVDLGVVTLVSTTETEEYLILTCQEYKNGYAFYAHAPKIDGKGGGHEREN